MPSTNLKDTVVGDVTVDWSFESYGSPGDGWSDPGEGPMIMIDSVWQMGDEVLKWIMPNRDYWVFEEDIYATGEPGEIANEPYDPYDEGWD